MHHPTEPKPTEHNDTPTSAGEKKGVGLNEKSGFGEKQLRELHLTWYYNWGDHSEITAKAEFIPMIFSPKRSTSKMSGSGDYVLGYNEPDNAKQSNVSVQEALEAWPSVVSLAKHVGSPAMAGNPVTGDWFPAFMKAKPKVSFVTVHWYKGADAKHFIKDIEKIHAAYGKPIWVTEFAPQTHGSSEKSPHKYTQAQVDTFISETLHWMDRTSYVHRYAWHDSRVGTSALFDDKGSLTATGRAYAAAH